MTQKYAVKIFLHLSFLKLFTDTGGGGGGGNTLLKAFMYTKKKY